MTNALAPAPSCSLAVSASDILVDGDGKDDDAALPSVLVVLETLVLLVAAAVAPPPRVRTPSLPRLSVCPAAVSDKQPVGAVEAPAR